MSDFDLDARLARDTVFLFDWPLCRVLLMNDASYPWCILVPRVTSDEGAVVTELYALNDEQRAQLDKESVALSRMLMQKFSGDKLNVAALGNVVSQLHIHHVVRFDTDQSWPAPVWGRHPANPYDENSSNALRSMLVSALADCFAESV